MRSITTKKSAKDGVYSAPEVVDGEQPYTNKADIWSLGCLFFEVMFQQTAFREFRELLDYANTSAPATRLPATTCILDQDPAVSEAVKSFISNAFQKERSSRPTAGFFLANLERCTTRRNKYRRFLEWHRWTKSVE